MTVLTHFDAVQHWLHHDAPSLASEKVLFAGFLLRWQLQGVSPILRELLEGVVLKMHSWAAEGQSVDVSAESQIAATVDGTAGRVAIES